MRFLVTCGNFAIILSHIPQRGIEILLKILLGAGNKIVAPHQVLRMTLICGATINVNQCGIVELIQNIMILE